MLPVKDILKLEDEYKGKVFIHHEGLFYRLYNKSAFWWHDNIKPFKLNYKFVKKAHARVVSLGFPAHKWEEYKKDL